MPDRLPNRVRNLRYDHEFDDQLERLRSECDDPQRVDDVAAGVEWAIAIAEDLHDLATTVPSDGRTVFVVKTDPAPPCVPALRFFFTEADDGLIEMRRVIEDPGYEEVDY